MDVEGMYAPSRLMGTGKTYRLTPMGNIYRSSFPSRKSCGQSKNSLSSLSSESRVSSQYEDVGSMTIEFLRARLLAERAASKSAKQKLEELQKTVFQLERRLEVEMQKREEAETALQDSLEKLLVSGSGTSSSCAGTDSELESLARDTEGNISAQDNVQQEREIRPVIEDREAVPNMSKQEPGEADTGFIPDADNVEAVHVAATLQGGVPVTFADGTFKECGSDTERSSGDETIVFGNDPVGKARPSESDEDDHTKRPLVGSRLYLTKVGVGRKIGRSSYAVKRRISGKAGKPKRDDRELFSELTGWVSYVVNMIETRNGISDTRKRRSREHHQEVRKDLVLENGESVNKAPTATEKAYVSFAKYLGLEDMHQVLEVHTDSPGMRVWRIKQLNPVEDACQQDWAGTCPSQKGVVELQQSVSPLIGNAKNTGGIVQASRFQDKLRGKLQEFACFKRIVKKKSAAAVD